ncbi:hypothetical protein [Catelliglobosispora koreensis]|uniref:hypothetical protein n=1 Tax=Catelliglobosispora koreensis TaxID=129052 RepID=UPI00037F1098|nr:hypothetical protein [Catelliglobosispora koreensis]
MRRFLAASVLAVAAFGMAACNTTSGTEAQSTPSATASPTPSITLVDKKTTCSNFETATMAAGLKMLGAMGEALKTADEKDPAKVEATLLKVVSDLKVGIAEMRQAAEKEAAQAADAELKGHLVTAAAELKKLEDEMAKVSKVSSADDLPNMETPALDAATDKIEELCK